ncbi:MAG: stage 0 sporulation family protein [bacterium]|nr:stage 0 sporulation family protein [bacterium]
MTKVVGIRFRNAGKIYYFDPKDMDMEVGSHAIVETARGVEFGTVMIAPREVEDEQVVQPLKPIIRVATPEDEETVEKNHEKEKNAYKICQEKIEKHGLDMKLVQAEYTFDNNKLLFYFTADGRIDFRELVKDLASVFRTRIELRQIGVRDETKLLGGMGICGRQLCCSSYLSDFVPVSIKMAKEQNLSLNPTKISGVCGRLMCCLKNEEETYEYLNSRLPGVGDYVTTDDGIKGEVASVNVLRQKVKVVVEMDDEKEIREYLVDQLKFKPRRKNTKLSEKELKELEGLEDEVVSEQPLEDEPVIERKPQKEFRERRERKDRDHRDRNDNNKDQKENKEQREHQNRSGKQRDHDGKSKNYDRRNHKKNKEHAPRAEKENQNGEQQSS